MPQYHSEINARITTYNLKYSQTKLGGQKFLKVPDYQISIKLLTNACAFDFDQKNPTAALFFL